MKISFRGDYALKAILSLAINYNKKLITAHELAKEIDAPIKFLEQILLDLKKGGFISSKRGNVGGYMLSYPPGEISVGQIVRFIEGPIEPISCVQEGYSNCTDINKCVFRKIWVNVALSVSKIIDNLNFEELVSQVSRSQAALTYSI